VSAASRMLIPRYFRPLILTLVIGAVVSVVGCVDKPTLSPIPQELVDAALVPEFGAIRQWGDAPGIISQNCLARANAGRTADERS